MRAALIAGVSIATLLCAEPSNVSAAWNADSWWNTSPAVTAADPTPRKAVKRSKPATSDHKTGATADKTPPLPTGLLHIIVSIDKQRATLFADGRPFASTAVSTGTPGHPTPMGLFTVIQKDRHHVSNLYDASMPYMQRITWSGSALHEGPLPGYPASHGCVRLTTSFAQLLWKATKMGARVVITRPEVTPLEFDHARLFAPKPRVAAAPPALEPPVKLVEAPVKMAEAPRAAVSDSTEPAATGTVAEVKVADAANSLAVAVLSVTGDNSKPAVTSVETVPAENDSEEQPTKLAITDGVGGTAEPETKSAEVQPVESAAPAAAEQVAAKPVETAVAESKTAASKPVEAKPAEVAAKLVESKPVEVKAAAAKPVEIKIAPTIAAPASIIVDERPKSMPATIVQEANGRPISVFASLKERKLYVRQGWKPLFEAPVSFENPEQPVGTHVYTAMGMKAEGKGLRWTVVSIPSATRRVAELKPQGRKSHGEHAAKSVEVDAPMPSPGAALDRIIMSPELVERISELITPGSSLIVSDNRLSDETGEYTDFIVVTR